MPRESPTVPPNNSVFRFNRETYSVKIRNIAEQATLQTILDLFQNMIGDIHKCEERIEGGERIIELTFSSRDAFMKALCMSGYTVAGEPMTVAASSVPSNNRLNAVGKQADDRRNLYVLGLPFDLTKSEFVEMFSRYGVVSHSVILATIDNSSRRRGFIVMSTHAEALSALGSFEVKGHVIEVSWAVVQRSQGQPVTSAFGLRSADMSAVVGFLDGGDRSTALPPSIPSASPAEGVTPALEKVPVANPQMGAQSFVVSIAPLELEPLLLPFGQIKKLDILEKSGPDNATGFVTVAVEYATADSAYEAKMTLDGQVYVDHVLKIEFIQPLPSACDTVTVQASQFPRMDGPSTLQVLRRPPLVNAPYSYNSRSTGMNTPTIGHPATGKGTGPTTSSAPTTPYPFSTGFGMSSYFASNTPLFDGTLDNARPLTRSTEA